jgi:predicted enzyme related to lactoylglutathione lyase
MTLPEGAEYLLMESALFPFHAEPTQVYNSSMNGPSYFEIQADNIEGAADFYHQVFGWKFTKADGLPVEYWRIETDGPRGGLLKRPAPAPPERSGTNAYVCSMEVLDFDDVAKKILAHGGRVALPKFAVGGVCWQGYFIDPEGNTFGIFQPDPNAK